jgi:hypothetical protein
MSISIDMVKTTGEVGDTVGCVVAAILGLEGVRMSSAVCKLIGGDGTAGAGDVGVVGVVGVVAGPGVPDDS